MRFDDAVLAGLERAAAEAGLTLSGYCAEVVVAALAGTAPPARQPVLPKDQRVSLQEAAQALMGARRDLNRVGVNLNQAVMVYHSTGQPPEAMPRILGRTEQAVDGVDANVKRIRELLGGA
jgi:hypothetical protein